MRLRRAVAPILALAIAACAESVKQEPAPAELVFAAFDSATATLPQPNDLALQAAPTLTQPLQQAQKQLLDLFIAAGGFPSDQEVPITIPITARSLAADGSYLATAAPAIDLASVTASTVAVLQLNAAGNTVARIDVDASTTAGSCTTSGCTPGVLTLRKKADANGRRWPAGARIAVAVRGGAAGVRTASGVALAPDQPIALIAAGKDLSVTENQPIGGLPPALAQQLEGLRALYSNALPWCNLGGRWAPPLPPAPPAACGAPPASSAFAAVATVFPVAELAAIQTFGVAPSAGTLVLIDSGSGVAPLPIDLLRTGPPIPPSTANTIALNPGFGPLAQGLTTLDGFSTTAMMLAQTSAPIDAGTVNGANVHVFRLGGATPTLVRELKQELATAGNPAAAGYVAQPNQIAQTGTGAPCTGAPGTPCFSTAIGLQPAVGAPTPAGTFYLPPLAENASYAVVVTSRVKNATGAGLAKPTVAKILLDITAPVSAGGQSLLAGVSAATAAALQRMKDELAPVMANLPAGTSSADVVSAWTFKTQTVTAGAASVVAFAAPSQPTAASFFTPAQVGAAYGVDPAAAFPGTAVAEFAEVTFPTVNLLLSGNTQGAFDPASPTPEPIVALVALPDPALVAGTCPAAFAPLTRCAPLVVFRHGLPRAKGDMLPIATALAAKGFVVAAIDVEKHGDRTYCTADNQCLPPATCVADPKLKTSADPGIVGRCAGGALLRKRVDCTLPDPQCAQPSQLAPKGIPLATGNLLVSLNLFRTRDTFRQDVIDEAALVSALAPSSPRPAGTDPFAGHLGLGPNGYAVHPDEVYLASLSLGSINSVLSLAVNPRFKKGAFHAGGATFVDIPANPASSDHAALIALLASATPPIAENTPAYLQFLQVAKWVLDPGDPANYGERLRARSPAVPVLSQIGLCDTRIPNAQSQFFTAMLGLPVPAAGAAGTGFTQWLVNSASTAACPADAVTHGVLIDPSTQPLLTAASQASFADFLATGAAQPTTVRP